VGEYRLILHGIKGARGVDESTTDRQEVKASTQDTHLETGEHGKQENSKRYTRGITTTYVGVRKCKKKTSTQKFINIII